MGPQLGDHYGLIRKDQPWRVSQVDCDSGRRKCARLVIPITTANGASALRRRVIRWCTLLQPVSKECGLLRELPIGKNLAGHCQHRSARAFAAEAAVSQPLLVCLRLRVLAHGLFQYAAFKLESDRIGCGVALSFPAAPLGCIQGRKEPATDLSRPHHRSAALPAETLRSAADDSLAPALPGPARPSRDPAAAAPAGESPAGWPSI